MATLPRRGLQVVDASAATTAMQPLHDRDASDERHLAAVALVVAIALTGLGFLIVHPEGLFNRHSDVLAFHLGNQTVLHDSWRLSHRLPLWRSDVLSGAPALTNPQSMYTHPLHLLFLLAKPERVIGLVIWLEMLVAALGAYYAAVVLRLSIPGRLVVAVATLFSYKSILAIYAGWLTPLSGIAAIPFVFAAAGAVGDRPSLRSALVLGAAGALSLHSGHPQFVYYTWLFAGAWSVVAIGWRLARGARRAAIRMAAALALAVVIALGLSAYVILPIARDLPLVTRGDANWAFFLGRPLTPAGLLTVFNPEGPGTPLAGTFTDAWEFVVYFGAVASVLAVVGATRVRECPRVLALLAGLLLCIALALGGSVSRLAFDVVPAFRLFRLPARVMFLGAFFVYCLAGVGTDVVLSWLRPAQSRRLVAVGLVALVALEGTVWARRYLRVPEAAPFAPGAEYTRMLATADPPARVASMGRSTPNTGAAAALGLQLVTGYDPFTLRHYAVYMDMLQYGRPLPRRAVVFTDVSRIAHFDMLAALDVGYLTSPDPVDVPPAEFSLAGVFNDQPGFRFYEGLTTGPVRLYRNRRPLGRAFFVSNVVQAVNEDHEIALTINADLRTTAIAMAPARGGASNAAPGDRVEIRHRSAGHLELAVRAANPRFLVISEVWHPGWSVRVDGREATLAQTDIALQGLWVPAGEHMVVLDFWPPGLSAGLAISAVTAACVIALGGLAMFLRRRSRRSVRLSGAGS